jgi:hypothetical protein
VLSPSQISALVEPFDRVIIGGERSAQIGLADMHRCTWH